MSCLPYHGLPFPPDVTEQDQAFASPSLPLEFPQMVPKKDIFTFARRSRDSAPITSRNVS